MAKPPSFQWYPKDCDTDENVRAMDDTEFGFYMRCLNHAWLNRGLPSDLGELGLVLGRTRHHLARVWPRVSRCFDLVDGRFVNKTQELQRTQQAEFIDGKKKAANARWKHNASASNADALRMECPASASASASANKNKHRVVVVDTAFEEKLDQVTHRIHERHPSHRGCSQGMVRAKLRIIAKKSPSGERLSRLDAIDRNHEKWCVYWAIKEPEYVKALENWLAPTMGRFDEDPPVSKAAPVPQRYIL